MEQPRGLATGFFLVTFALVCSVFGATTGASAPPPLPTGTRGAHPPEARLLVTCAPEYPLSLVSRLPAEDRLERHRAFRFANVPQPEAESLLATVETAAYFFDTGELFVLDGAAAAGRASVWRSANSVADSAVESRPAEDLGAQSVEDFLRGIGDRFPNLQRGAWGRFLIKVPRVERRPAGALRASGVLPSITSGVVLNEGFETTPWTRWQPDDNTYGAYQWGSTTCAAHAGNRAADGIRGGTVGTTLTCSAGYPLNLESWLDDTQCENFQGASAASLDLYVWLDMESGSDDFALFYQGSDQDYYGLGFSGNTGGWIHLIFDLRHWYKLGDLATNACNRLSLLFESDDAGVVGTGVRVDDVRIVAGPASGLSCSASANPGSGQAPLTVNFNGTVAGASGSQTYSWSFGDGGTAATQNPTHVYTSQGDYDVRFRVRDGNDSCYSYLVVHVTSPGGGAQPEAGTYVGTTSQGEPLEFDVDASSNLTRWKATFACGGITATGTVWSGGCPVSGGTFTCGDDSCPTVGGNVKLTGTFGTSTSASGTLNLAVRPAVSSSCCTATGITWSATLQGGGPLTAAVTSDVASGTVPLTVQFGGSASGGTPPYTYAWDFGDGSAASTEQ
ncbi:MAG: PKD domain-containing protein, partial [Thermoanaerobaculales bacterium]